MGCPAYQPVDVLNQVLLCVQDALSATTHGIPKQIVVGPSNGYSCCDGSLLVVSPGEIQHVRDGRDSTGTTSGNAQGCSAQYRFGVTVSVQHCIETYARGASGTAVGPAPAQEVRTADALNNLADLWSLLEKLRCCGTPEFRNCSRMQVTRGGVIGISGQCLGYEVHLTFELTPCCVRT